MTARKSDSTEVKKNTSKAGVKKRRSSAVQRGLGHVWSPAEVRYLKTYCNTKTAKQIAKELGRSVSLVRAKATALGLRRAIIRSARITRSRREAARKAAIVKKRDAGVKNRKK